jgi:type IV pilus assembly protein PilY1
MTPHHPSLTHPIHRAAWLLGLLGGLALLPLHGARAATADVSNAPLGTASTQKAKPNLMFILDDSGSMAWDFMPDELDTNDNEVAEITYGYFSAQCNGVAYNPAITYTPPIKADGTFYPAASFTNAKIDGYSSTSGTINLGSSDVSYTSEWISLVHRNYYYVYKSPGVQPARNWTYTSSGTVDTSTTFYRECMVNSVGQYVFAQVLLSSLTTAQKQNYANWFSYYRTRRLTMRSAAGQAFQGLGSDFRVGFTKISDVTVNPTNGFLGVSDFDATQKSVFFDRLYGTTGQNYTPLRGALSKVGRYYGNRISGQTDPNPNKYSCQRNYTLLSTDGYWNTNAETGAYGPYQLDGTTPVAQQDGDEARPMKDGSRSTYTVTTTTTTPGTKTVTTALQWQRSQVTVSSCLFGLGSRYSTQPQRCNPNRTGSTVRNYTTSSVSVATSTYSDGTLTGTSTTGPTTTETLGSTTTSANPTCSSWTNIGTATTSACELDLGGVLGLLGLGPSGGTTVPAWVAGVDTTSTTTGTATTATVQSAPVASGGDSNTLADIAQYYYDNDLRTDVENRVPGFDRDTNPRQHMTTFTLGLGLRGTLSYDRNYLTQSTGDFADLKSGAKNWPVPSGTRGGAPDATHIDDLWHAAVNGRGQYFSASDPTSLADAITTTLNEINKASGSGSAAAASALTPVSGDDWLFLPSFTTVDWTGDLRAFRFTTDANGNLVAPVISDATRVWSAGERLDARTTARTLWFNSGAALAAFNSSNLSAAGRSGLFAVSCATGSTLRPSQCDAISSAAQARMTGANLVSYLAGDTSLYMNNSDTGLQVFRTRPSRLGDLVNASPVYVGAPPFNYADAGYSAYKSANASRTKVVYVAANDGMLHAFKVSADSTGGSELWAFMPTPVLSKLWKLADRNYSTQHQYLVDATPNVADVYDGTRWRSILVGGLGAGGRGYYALDVTTPETPTLLWEISNATAGFENLGLSYGNPVVTKNAAGTWVVAFTTGTNNTASGDGVGRLYTVNAVTGALISTVATSAGDNTTPSNLGRLNAWVKSDTDNTALRFYAGDMLGNLWRFDPDDRVPPSGSEAVLLGQALTASGGAQPITAKPVLTEATVNGASVPIISFGTGRMLGVTDLTDTTRQTIYSVKDGLGATGLGVLRTTATSGLVSQALGSNRQITSPKTVDWSTQNGWYVDLDQPASGTPRERVHLDGIPLSAGVLAFVSTEPIDDACSQGGQSYLYQFDLASGAVLGVTAFDSIVVGVNRVVGKGDQVSAIVTTQKQEILLEASGGSALPTNFSIRRSGWRELID